MTPTARKIAKDMLWRAARLVGMTGLAGSRGAVVLGLHRVAPSKLRGSLDCPPALFDKLCRFLTRNFRVVPLVRLAENLRLGRPVHGSLALTFDDGYQDNLLTAVPILQKYGLPATFFLTTGYIGSDFVPEWDKSSGDPRPLLNWEEVRRLHRMGFEIGGHTRTHRNLAGLTEDALRSEVQGCRQDIIDATGMTPTSFAYPFGQEKDIQETGRKIIKEAGFTCCCSLFGGINHPHDDPMHLRRIPVSDWYISVAHFGGDLLVSAIKDRIGRVPQ